MPYFKMFPDLVEIARPVNNNERPITENEETILGEYLAAVESAQKERGGQKRVSEITGKNYVYVGDVLHKDLVRKGFVIVKKAGNTKKWVVYGATRRAVSIAAERLGRQDILEDLETRRIRHELFHEKSIPLPEEQNADALDILSLDSIAENISILDAQAKKMLRDADRFDVIIDENERKIRDEHLPMSETKGLEDEIKKLTVEAGMLRSTGIPLLKGVITQQISGRNKFQEEINGMVKDLEKLSNVDLLEALVSITAAMWGTSVSGEVREVLQKHGVL